MAGQHPRWGKPEACRGCALEHNGFGFAPPSGPIGARLTFIGEALGYEEAIAGEPFYGSAGGVLTRICIRAGIERAHTRIANIVSCRPPQDYLVGAPWEALAIAQCRTYLLPVLASVPNGGVVVTLGATPLNAVLGLTGQKGITVKDFHGTVHEVTRVDGTMYYVVPTFHPSHLQRGAMNLLEVVTQDLKRAWTIAHKGFQRSPSQLVVDPPVEWFDRWVVDHLAKVEANPDGVHLSLDSEFPEKGAGDDEGELLDWNAQTPMTRVNGGNDKLTGWSVPYVGDYIRVFEKLMAGMSRLRGWAWLWNKYADWDHFRAAGHTLSGIEGIDGMWLWHHIQSDVPRGLGFVAPMASDFGAWKHWGKVESRFGEYAAADGVQNWRVCMWVMDAAVRLGLWDMFMRDWHDRDQYVLRPAYEMGVPINKQALVEFHEENQRKLGSVLERIKLTTAQGVLKPKLGYPKRPKGIACPDCVDKCPRCGNTMVDDICQNYGCEGTANVLSHLDDVPVCSRCNGTRMIDPPPPATIIGKPKKGGSEAKLAYLVEGLELVEKEIEIDVRVCLTCSPDTAVGPKHKCPLPRRAAGAAAPRKGRKRRGGDHMEEGSGETPLPPADDEGTHDPVRPVAQIATARVRATRWFWKLPFNPDAPAQVLAYFAQQGIEAPVDKKTQKKTTNKKALADMAKQHSTDPFFQLQLDWKAVQKVDAVYAVGTMALLDKDNRVHPEYLPIPSTLRDSARRPNLTNVVADKSGVQGLASGFRRVIEARDGVPLGITDAELVAWEKRWIQ